MISMQKNQVLTGETETKVTQEGNTHKEISINTNVKATGPLANNKAY